MRPTNVDPGQARVLRTFWLIALAWTICIAGLIAYDLQCHDGFTRILNPQGVAVPRQRPSSAMGGPSLGAAGDQTPDDGSVTQADLVWLSRKELYRHTHGLALLWLIGVIGIAIAGRAAVKRYHERKVDRQALLASEQRFRRLAEAATEGVFVHQDGIIVESNNAFAKLIEVQPEEIVGKSVLDLIAPEYRDIIIQRMQVADDSSVEVVGLNVRGERVPVEIQGRNVGDGAPSARIVCVRDLRRRKRAEAELKETQLRFQTLVENIGEGFVVVDPNEIITFSNLAADRIFGLTDEQLVGHSLREFVDDTGWRMIQLEGSRRRTHEISSYELEIIRPGGERRFVLVTASPLFSEDGEYLASFGPLVDMTERKRAEEALRLQRDLSIALGLCVSVETAMECCLDVALSVSGMDCGMIYVYDYSIGEMYVAAARHIPSDTLARLRRLPLSSPQAAMAREGQPAYTTHAALSQQLGIQLELPEIKAVAVVPILHGSQALASINLGSYTKVDVPSPVRATLEAISSQLGAGIARIQAEEALRESEARYRELVENVGEGIVVTDSQRRIVLANRATERILGIGPGMLTGRSLRDFTITADLQYSDAQYEARRKGRGGTYELRVIRPDGQQRNLMITANSRMDKAGRYAGAFGVIRDMTEAKRIQERLFYEQKEQSLAALAGGIAHDFNNILMGMISSATVVYEDTTLTPAAWEALHSITVAAKRMSDLTSKLLSYAKGSTYQPRAIVPKNLVLDSMTILRGSVPSSVEIEIDVPDDLWPVEADAGQINQVLLNLYINAIEAMHDQPGWLIVRAQNEQLTNPRECFPSGQLRAGDYVVLSVIDTGGGMDPQTVIRVFEPFFSTKAHGRGLGLSAVHGIIQLHNGGIDVLSQPGQGTTFHIYLKRAGAALVQDLPVAPVVVTQVAPRSLEAGVLFVDDEPDIRMMVSRMLQRRGYRVYAAADGPSALVLFQEHFDDIGVAVLDMQMPHMSGTELLGHLRRLQPALPAILSSGYPLDAERSEISEDWSALLQKPYDFEVLLATLQQVFAQRVIPLAK